MSNSDFAAAERQQQDDTLPGQSSPLSEARFRTIFERSPLAIQIFSPDGLTIHVNRAWERMWNVPPDSARDYNILQDQQLARRGVMPLIERAFNGESVTLPEVKYDAKQTLPEGYETSYIKWTRSWIYPITDENGGVREVVLTHEDITNSKHAEEVLKDRERLLDAVIETLPIGIWISDASGHLIHGNEAGRRIWGGGGFAGLDVFCRFRSWWHDTGRPIEPDEWALTRAVRKGQTTLDEVIDIECFDGTRKTILNSALPIYNEDGVVAGAIALNQDITEKLKSDEALARSNAELERFAYVASHDLQEPLRTVSSYVQLLERRYKGRLDTDADDFIQFAVDGAARMKTLINDLLEYSRLSTRARSFEMVDCGKLVDDVFASLRSAQLESGATLTRDGLPTVMGDATQLSRVFQNLISNGIKFRGSDPPVVHVSAESGPREWVFRVRDNGIGIDPEYFDRIFVIFQRLHTAGEYPGTGIGLAVCKKIVERHCGRIWVKSQPHNGTEICFTIAQNQEARL